MKNNDSPQFEKTSLRWFLAVIAGLPFAALVFGPRLRAQGVLTPPGPPAPTMKTLDQLDARLDPRIPVNATNTPSDGTDIFTISTEAAMNAAANANVNMAP